MALKLVDRIEKLHSETLFLYFCCTCVTTSPVYTCKRIWQTSVRKSRNQCKHQQLCVNYRARGQFWCVEGSKYAHWIGLYLSFHLNWVLGPFVHGRLQNLQTSEVTFAHVITPLSCKGNFLLLHDFSLQWNLDNSNCRGPQKIGFIQSSSYELCSPFA